MNKLYNLKLKFLVLVSALVFSGLIPSMLSGHSTGAWLATSTCGTKAWIFVSTWDGDGSANPTQGIYIDTDKDGFIRNASGTNKSVCSLVGTNGGELTGAGASGNPDYFAMTDWEPNTALGLPLTIVSHTHISTYNGIKKYLRDFKGVDTSQITVSNIWVPGGTCTNLSIYSMMVIDVDVTKLESGTTRAHIATTTQDFLGVLKLMAG